ncbi:DUF1707 domain-containing protein [Micromonospora sp. NPDC047548]|uniref:DUF1707 SHOCT-like domain-containing protein n=1 Tax=Micromonospora sp. NPDC047548 TaxID=3155624 RepID=UPI0033E3F8C7
MERQGGMRAADTDRAATAERLRVALEEGRLDLHEYDERLQQTYGAKTYAELDAVLADLPGPAPAQRSALAPREPAGVPAAPGGLQPGPDGSPDGTAGPGRDVAAGAPAGGTSARWLAEVWGSWLRVAAILTAIWLISSAGSRDLLFYWPLWALGPWGAVLLVRTAGGFATGAPGRDVDRWGRRRAERADRRRARREHRRRGR